MSPSTRRRMKRESERGSENDSYSSLRESDIESDSSLNEELVANKNDNDVKLNNGFMIWMKNNKIIVICILISVMIITMAVWQQVRNNSSCGKHVEDLKKTLKGIREKFPSQEDALWKSIYSALVTVSQCNSSCPRVVLILNRGDAVTKAISNCLVSMVAEECAPLLPFREKKHMRLSANDLKCDDCISKQRELVKNRGTVIIYDLEKIPSSLVGKLHFFCDEYDPDFAKAVYFLTMSVNNDEKHPTKAAEMAFEGLWKEMVKGEFDALVTRLTSEVVFVKPENNSPCHA